jgi:hypothetical protein
VLILQPEIVIPDEPTSALDVSVLTPEPGLGLPDLALGTSLPAGGTFIPATFGQITSP